MGYPSAVFPCSMHTLSNKTSARFNVCCTCNTGNLRHGSLRLPRRRARTGIVGVLGGSAAARPPLRSWPARSPRRAGVTTQQLAITNPGPRQKLLSLRQGHGPAFAFIANLGPRKKCLSPGRASDQCSSSLLNSPAPVSTTINLLKPTDGS